MCPRGWLVGLLVLAMSAPVFGQKLGGGIGGGQNGQGNQAQQGHRPIGLTGIIQKIVPGGIVMSNRNGQAITVMVTPATKVRLTGLATSDFIKPGIAVEFTAEVDKKHTVAEKITSLSVVTLTAQRIAGLFPVGTENANPAGADNIGSVAGKNAEKHKAAPPIQLPATLVVRGQVKSFKAGKLMVTLGHGGVKAELADNAHIAVDLADINAARKGDHIMVRCRAIQRGMPQADSVTIRAADLFSGGGKKKLPKFEKMPAPSKDGSGDDAGDLKADKKPAAEQVVSLLLQTPQVEGYFFRHASPSFGRSLLAGVALAG